MKKALVMTLALVLGLGFGLAAQTVGGDFSIGNLSGLWKTTLTFGFEDVTITDPGATFTVSGGTYAVTQGTVTIGDRVVSGTYEGTSYTETVPGGTYTVGPWSVLVPGGTYPVTDGTVTIPSQDVDVQLPDCTCTVTTEPFEFTIPELHDKVVENVLLFAAEKTIVVDEPKAYYDYSGLVEYDYVIQTGSAPNIVILQEGSGFFLLEDVDLDENGEVPFPAGSWDWNLLCWPDIAPLWLHGELDVSLYPEIGKHLQVNFPPFEVKVKCDDLADSWMLMLLGRTATGFDQNNNDVTVMLKPHFVDLSADDTTVVEIPAEVNWAYTEEPFEDQHWLFFKVPPKEFTVEWPNWPRCCTSSTPRPNVTIGWENFDTAVYQYIGEYTTLQEIKDDVEAAEEPYNLVLDKIGFGFLNTDEGYYEVDPDGHIIIPQGDIDGTFLLGSYVIGEVTITIPAQDLTCICEGELITITIPAQPITVTGQTVTIEDQYVDVDEDEIVILDYMFTITVLDQDIDITVPGGTFAVSNQTVTIGAQIIDIPGWTQTIERLPTIDLSSVLSVDYTLGAWVFGSTMIFDSSGLTNLFFKATGALGAFSFASLLDFDPMEPAFEIWVNTAQISIAGVSFYGIYVLDGDPQGSAWVFGGKGSAGAVTVGAEAQFNHGSLMGYNYSYGVDYLIGNYAFTDCGSWLKGYYWGALEADHCFCFSGLDIWAEFPFGCVDILSKLRFATTGFSYFEVELNDIETGLAWLLLDDLDIKFEVDEKSIAYFDLQLVLADVVCIQPYLYIDVDGYTLNSFTLYAVSMDYSWNGVTFKAGTLLDSIDGTYTIDSDGTIIKSAYACADWTYDEFFAVLVDGDSCCGGAFSVEVFNWFDMAGSEGIFDWTQTNVDLSFGVGSAITVSTGLEVTAATGFDAWTVGFEFTW